MPTLRAAVTLTLVLSLSSSCRDEQAGPKPKRALAPSPASGGAQVKTLDLAPPNLTFRSQATFAGGAITYLGTLVEPAVPQPGQPMRLSHYFRANQPPPPGFNFFVHLIDPINGQMVSNADHAFGGGAAPMGSWPVGRVVEDQHVLQAPAQPTQLVLGFWQDNQRLPVDDPTKHDGEFRMFGPKLGGAAGGPELPEYRAARASKPPVIDGKLDDESWSRAVPVVLTRSFDGSPAQRKTTFRLTWDDAFLYVAFDCEDPDVWGTLLKKDDPIYNEEVVEVFLDANGDGATYNELQVSPHNVNFDASFVSRRSDLPAAMAWESGMATAVLVRGTLDDDHDVDQGWSAEMKIPIAGLNAVPRVPPLKGDVWRFNAYRLEHFVHGKQIEGQSFSPLFVGDFHALPRFGKLLFD